MMPKKIVQISLGIMLATVLLAIIAIITTSRKFPQQSQGRLVFAQTYERGVDLDKIIISSDEGEVTLLHRDNYWVVKEADYYYANIELINLLIQDLNNSTYYSRQAKSSENTQESDIKNGVQVRTYAKGKLLDDIIVGKQAPNPNYHFIKNNNQNDIWLAEGMFELPKEFYSWIMQPISELPPEMIEKIAVEENIFFRDRASMPFINSEQKVIQTKYFLENASQVFALNVHSKDNFKPTLYPNQKSIYFTTFPGLVVGYHIYSDGKEYWLNVTLKTTPLPKQFVSAYIKENQVFYDGWYFMIPATQGKILSSTFMCSTNNGRSEK